MKTVGITDPQGRRWKVAVRMLPWGLRWRGPRTRKDQPAEGEVVRGPRWYDGLDIPDLSFLDEGLGGFVVVLLLVAAIAIGVLFLLPVFIFLVEVLLVLIVMAGAVLVRVLLRQPWIVDAVSDDGTRLTWKVIGYLKSRRVVEEIATQLRIGTREPRAADAILVE